MEPILVLLRSTVSFFRHLIFTHQGIERFRDSRIENRKNETCLDAISWHFRSMRSRLNHGHLFYFSARKIIASIIIVSLTRKATMARKDCLERNEDRIIVRLSF